MSVIDSSVQGYLAGAPEGTVYGSALEDLFHDAVVGITGLQGDLVRPRYQDDPPTWPQFDVDWCAFNVYVRPSLWNAFKTLRADGSYTIEGTEVLEVTVSFYGPNYQAVERSYRDGMQLGQNRDDLVAAGIGFIEFAEPVVVPVLMKEKWVKKVDIRGTFHRWAVRVYPVRTLLSAEGTIRNQPSSASDEFVETFKTDPPPT